MECCFDSGVMCDTHVSSSVTMWLKNSSPCSLYHVRKGNALASRFYLCSSVSIFDTQREHNFRYSRQSDTISWRSNREMCGKCRESDETVNRLFSRTFSSTARTKSPLTTDGRPLRCSSRTFSRPSLKFLIHLTKLTMNVCRLHIPCIQETDNRPHFTGGGPLDCLEHVKHTERCISTI
jgi:hypothetical protein